MKSILEEFAHGNISPHIGTVKKGTHYAEVMQTMYELEEKISGALPDDLKEIMRKYCDIQLEATTIAGVDRFIYGYRLGALMSHPSNNQRDVG